ncbi:MAG: copper-binding protein [Pseudomonadota bacterium]|nr:copper-binding protein [Pseudomonadota bacterium]
MNIIHTTSALALALTAVLASACAPAPTPEAAREVGVAADPAVAPMRTGDMDMAGGMPGAMTEQSATATGTITVIDAAAGKLTIDHGPVESLQWPAMVMGFQATPEQLSQVTVGQPVQFDFTMRGRDAVITRITPVQ